MIETIITQAAEQRAAGNPEAAAELLSDAVLAEPGNIRLWRGLGEILLELNQTAEAVQCFERVLALAPGDAAALNDLGYAHLANRSYEFGLPYLEQAAELSPENVVFLGNLANGYHLIQRFEDERAVLERAMALPGAPETLALRLGECLAILGDLEAARALFERIAAEGRHEIAALRGLCNLERQTKDNGLAERIERALARATEPEERRLLQQCAAKCRIESGDPVEGFRRVMAAKAEISTPFDRACFERQIEAVILADARLPPVPAPSAERPVFIVGMPRCGSTLLEKFLAGHSRLHGAGERPHMPRIAAMLGLPDALPEEFAETLAALAPEAWQGIARGYMDLLRPRGVIGDRLCIDKFLHNFLYIGLILRLFPEARIIHARRHPLDACVAIYTAPLQRDGHAYAERLEDLGWYYRHYLRLMAHWQSRYPAAILPVRYEDVLQDPAGQMQRVTGFLGLPFEEGMLDHTANRHVSPTISKWQVHQPLYHSSVARWKPLEPLLGPILGELRAEAEAYEREARP